MLLRYTTGVAAVLALTAVLFTDGVAQTGIIAGQISNEETAAPLGGARVEAIGPGGEVAARAVTDTAGRFRLAGLSPGSYTVVVGALAFETRRMEQVEVRAGDTTDLNISLASIALRLNPVVVSVGRSPERAMDAPASVAVIDSRAVDERPVTTPADHVRAAPGVDVITSGIQSANVVARGFNNIFSGAMASLTDHRIAGIPSLRVNLLHFVPTTNEDIERIEVVLGPGSALYGPNTASGVLHILTKSPLTEQGTTVSLGGGERDLFQGSFRTAHLLGDNFGIKLSGQYLRANEWPHVDPTEESEQAFCAQQTAFCVQRLIASEGISQEEAAARVARIALRDEQIERWGGEVRADWQVTPEARAVFTVGGTNTANAVELTGLGAGQVLDWRYMFYQGRFNYNRLFAQAYLNTSDAGDTFLLRNGAPIVDRSKLFVSQVQHGFAFGERQSFTYGGDFIRTMPETEGTIHGRHEADDRMSEFGAYLQSETRLSPRFDLVLAGRIDTHSHLDDPVFSPRAALVFKPADNHNFRLTFNRAFSTPTAINLFLDLGTPFPTEAAALAQLGYSIRVQGTLDGISLFDPATGWQMRSPFEGGGNQLMPPHSPDMWQMAVDVLYGMGAFGPPESLQAQQQRLFLQSQTPTDPAAIGINFWNVGTGERGTLATLDIPDIPQIRESTNQTYEVGYKGLLGGRVLLAADVWFEQRKNFVTPLTMQTPFLLLDSASIHTYMQPRFAAIGHPDPNAAAGALAGGMSMLPLGVISSEDVHAQGAQTLMSYRNFGDVNLWGTDLALRAMITDEWSVGLTGSLVNRDHFFSEGEFIALNAPKRKGTASVAYRQANGFNGEVRARHTAGFPAASGVYFGAACVPNAPAELRLVDCTDSYTLFDLVLGYRLPFRGVSIQGTVQNVFDTDYRSFPGVPEIGRLALLRLRYEF